jgi:phospholipase A1/A2
VSYPSRRARRMLSGVDARAACAVHYWPSAVLLLCASASACAQDLATCASIDDDAARLRCYDALSGRAQRPPNEAPQQLQYRWEQHLLNDSALAPFTLEPYQPTYVLLTHLASFNYAPYRPFDPEDNLSRNEVKFGFSLQTKLLDDLFGHDGDVWLGYTQTSYWQLFNTDISSPFRETDYNPEARIAFLTKWDLPGLTLRGLNFGIRHDSNGQSGTLSRSWNRVFADFQLTRGSLLVSVRPWVRVFGVDDNPDIEDYYGHYDVRASYERNNQLFSLTLQNPFDRYAGAQLNWSIPLSGRLRALVQWYYGYGENLIDYNHKNNRIGIGLLLSDW